MPHPNRLLSKVQPTDAKPQKKPGVDGVMPFDERGQIIIGQAFHKRLEFLEKDTVIRETP